MREELLCHLTNFTETMNKRQSLIIQEGALKSYFPQSIIRRRGEQEIIWEGSLTPNALSATYDLKLHYCFKDGLKVFVTHPAPLPLAKGKDALPHVYSHKKQELCLYYPKTHEWDTSYLYVHTIIPWAAEWLLHYELWVCTGIWSGGGIEHNEPKTSN